MWECLRQVGQSKEGEVKKLPEDDDSEGDVGHKMDCVSISLCVVFWRLGVSELKSDVSLV